MPNRFARVGSGENGHDRGDPQFGQPVRMRGVVGRQVDREPGFDSLCDDALVRDYDQLVAFDGLVRERDDIPAGVGGDELF